MLHLVLFTLIPLALYAQVDVKPVDCTSISQDYCNQLKIREGENANKINMDLFTSSRPSCTPISVKTFRGQNIKSIFTIYGFKNNNCQMAVADVHAHTTEVCLIKRKDLALYKTDRTPEENQRFLKILADHCKTINSQPTSIKAKLLNLKTYCNSGKADSCKGLQKLKDDYISRCNESDETKDICILLDLPILPRG